MAVAMPITTAAELCRKAGLKVVETGIEHGTVTVVGDGEAIEVTQTRVDLDTTGGATVAFSDDWQADAERRDFTVNALYVTADGLIEDPLDARKDLEAGRLRFVGDASRRVEEDALRMCYCRFLPRFERGGTDRGRWWHCRHPRILAPAFPVNALPVRSGDCLASQAVRSG